MRDVVKGHAARRQLDVAQVAEEDERDWQARQSCALAWRPELALWPRPPTASPPTSSASAHCSCSTSFRASTEGCKRKAAEAKIHLEAKLRPSPEERLRLERQMTSAPLAIRYAT